MVHTSDWRNTYCTPEAGNVRYPSNAKYAYNGWAYYNTKDVPGIQELAFHRPTQALIGGLWVVVGAEFDGPEPDTIDFDPDSEDLRDLNYDPMDPNETEDNGA